MHYPPRWHPCSSTHERAHTFQVSTFNTVPRLLFPLPTQFCSFQHSSTCMVPRGQMSVRVNHIVSFCSISINTPDQISHSLISSSTACEIKVMATILKMKFPLLLLLGIVFLALVCVSSGIAQHEQGNPCQKKCLQRCNKVNEESRRHECRSRCEGWPERCEEEEEEEEGRSRHKEPGRRERGRQEGEKEEERREKRQPRRGREQQEEEEEEERENRLGNRRPRLEREEEEGEEDEEWRGSRRHEDPDERQRRERRREREESESQRGERRRRRHEREEEEGSSSSSSSSERRNPFFFRSNRFQTLFENENGRIRLLQRFDKRSNLFQNLQNYRLLEYRSKPHTLFLPQHTDADFILVVLTGRAILTVVNPDDRNSFNLERGDAIKLPAGTIAYLANRDNDEDLRVVDLAIPVNTPGQFQSFFPSSSQNQPSYFRGFSKDILEASLNTKYEEIERVLLEEQQQRRGRKERLQSQEANDPIVKVSREQIEELSRNAKSSSKKSTSSESEPFNLRSRSPIYSNKFGKFFEITPEKNPQLQDLNLLLNSVEIREGALLLPHYNSRAFVIVVVNEGKGQLELVAQRNEQQQQEQGEEEEEEQQEEDERSRQVQRYRARLSPGDVFIIPSSHPVAVNASSDLSLLGFGINAENNQRNFLAGEDDNVISQIHRTVKEVAFPGSAKEVDRLFDNQKQSHFASAQPQQREDGSQRRRSPLSSILGAFY